MRLNRWGSDRGLIGGRKYGTSHGPFSCGITVTTSSSLTSTVWPAANLAIYAPVVIDEDTKVTQLWTVNGAAVAGNVDIGLYSVDGVRLASAGSTAQSGVNLMQKFDITDLYLGPGTYYLAVSLSDAATATLGGQTQTTAVWGKIVGLAEETSALPLPAVATFATYTRLFLPLIGFVGDAVL